MLKNNFFILISLLALFMMLSQASHGQENADTIRWTKSGSLNASFSNVGFSNWAAGGANAISLGLLSEGKFQRESQRKILLFRWLGALGMNRIGNSDNPFKKTDDQLILGIEYAQKFKKEHLNIVGLIEFRSQFLPSYEYKLDSTNIERKHKKLSDIFAPAYLLTSLGIQYKNKIFSAALSPLTGKITMVLDDSLAAKWSFGVPPNTNIREELGANLCMRLETKLMENISILSAMNLFGGYKAKGNIDINWETLLTFKINKYFNTSFVAQMIYDDDIKIPQKDGSPKKAVQLKHIISLAIGLKF